MNPTSSSPTPPGCCSLTPARDRSPRSVAIEGSLPVRLGRQFSAASLSLPWARLHGQISHLKAIDSLDEPTGKSGRMVRVRASSTRRSSKSLIFIKPSYFFPMEAPSMLFSHRFGSAETLTRAQYWLTHHGFEVVPNGRPGSRCLPAHPQRRLLEGRGRPRPDRLDRAFRPRGMAPGIPTPVPDSVARQLDPGRRAHPNDARPANDGGAGTPIHWHSRRGTDAADPLSSKVVEYMFSRWE